MYFDHELVGNVGVVSNSYQNGYWRVTVVRCPGVDTIWLDDSVLLVGDGFRCKCVVKGIKNGKVINKMLLEVIETIWTISDWRGDGF